MNTFRKEYVRNNKNNNTNIKDIFHAYLIMFN